MFLVFVDMLAVGLVIPLFPYYASKLGADASIFGYIGSVYGLLQVVGSPLSTSTRAALAIIVFTFVLISPPPNNQILVIFSVGGLSDRLGRTKILALSFVASAVSYMMMGLANSLWLLCLSRIPVGLLKQTMGISYAYVTDLTDSSTRAKNLG